MSSPEEPRFDPVLVPRLVVTTPDGVELVADAWVPGQGTERLEGAFPTILERTPYGRALPRITQVAREAASRGYVYLVQDVRGRGDSGGEFMFMMNDHEEGADGEVTVDWLRTQPWWNGAFATAGGSFSAANSAALAIRRPAGLVAQIQRDSGTNYYRWMFRNHGMALVGVLLPWAAQQGILSHEAQKDPQVRLAFEQMNREMASMVEQLPITRGQTSLSLAPGYENMYFDILETGDDGPFWRSPMMRLEDHWDSYPTDVSVLLLSGWFAHHAAGNVEKFHELSARSQGLVQLILGPWVHSHFMGELTTAGDVDFGPEAGRYGPVPTLWMDWFDTTVRGIPPVEAQPAIRYFVMGTGDGHRTAEGRLFYGGQWRESEAWPLPDTELTPYYFHASGLLSTALPEEGQVDFDFDPEDPCPGIGSTNLQSTEHPSFVLPGPWDQRNRADFAASRGSTAPLAERPDVISFSTGRLSDALEVTGPIAATVIFSTTALDTDVVVKLVDVHPPSPDYPDGYAMLITEGMVRLRYRDGSGTSAPVTPGQIYEVEVELTPTSTIIKAGHALRIDVTSSHFPTYDVNPNTGEPVGRHTHTVIAHQRVWIGGTKASRIVLPVQPHRE